MDNTEFQMWRRQGGILRHAQPGQRINPAQAPSLLTLLEKNQMRGRFDANRGVVVISSGTSSQIRELWYNHGSYAVREARREKIRSETQRRAIDREQTMQDEWNNAPSAGWIVENFGNDFANLYNRAALARYLERRVDKFEGLVNWRWQEGCAKLGAITSDQRVDFPKLRTLYELRADNTSSPL